jgi:hypothetical protein
MIEDYDDTLDKQFIEKWATQYFRDLYNDLLMRSNQQDHLDKVNFIEYTKLPGIINDRLHFMFMGVKGNGKSSKSGNSPDKASPGLKGSDHVTEKSFEENLVRIFSGDLDSKMKFTFEM